MCSSFSTDFSVIPKDHAEDAVSDGVAGKYPNFCIVNS